MKIDYLTRPKFSTHQEVRFMGGKGKIKSIQQQDKGWAYTIKMSMGVKPDFGRVGAETTIILEEQDIYRSNSNYN